MKQWTFALRAKVSTLEYSYNFLLFFQVWDLVIFSLSRPGQRLKGGEQRWQKNKPHQLLFARMPDSLAKLNSVSAVTGNRAFPLGTWTPEPRAFISLHLLLFVHMSLTRRMQRRCYVMDLDSGIIWFYFFRRWADLIKGLITFTTVNIMFFWVINPDRCMSLSHLLLCNRLSPLRLVCQSLSKRMTCTRYKFVPTVPYTITGGSNVHRVHILHTSHSHIWTAVVHLF